jgi:gliding motility-associated-like protein
MLQNSPLFLSLILKQNTTIRMKTFTKQILAFLLVFSVLSKFEAQCTLTTIATDQTITCGDCVSLSAFGSGNGAVAFQENFNSGSPVGWGFTQAVTIANNTCGVPSPDGTPFMWMGDASVNPRDMSTVNLNVAIGGTICFQMRYSEQGDASPCEGPDEPGEGVYLQYSINNGATWVQIQYYQPDPVVGSPTVAWNTYCANIPAAAMTSATRFRWHQDAVSGAEYDHWGIDNVSITLNDPTYQIKWLYGPQFAYPVGNGGGINPTPVCPLTTTTYNAQISNGTITCNSSVTITVVNPTIVITAPNDTSICPGTCIPLPTQAYELVSPASTPTFSNFEPNVSIVTPQSPIVLPCASFSGCACAGGGSVGFGGTCPPTPGTINASADLAVAGLNGNNLGNSAPTNGTSQITGLCIPSLSLTGFCSGLDLADVNVILEHPNGTQVVLASVGSLTGTTILNMCFQLGAPAISTGSGTYTSTFSPQNSWASLNGLVSEGTWKLKITGVNNQLCISTVNLTGWNMSFNDPQLTTPVNYSWSPNSPASLITGATTLNPTVCPPLGATTFTITATDLVGCTSVSEPVTVTSAVCCPLVISDTNRINPTCGASNGTITVITTGAGAGLEFSRDGGVTWIPATGANGVFTGLPAGTYTIQVRDVTCTRTISNVVLTNSAVVPTFVATPTQPTCSAPGSILVTPTGASPFSYSINGGAFALGTTATTNVFGALTAGSYPIQVRDVNGCLSTTASTILTASGGPTIITVTPTQSTCGLANGVIFISASGTGPLTFSIDNGVTFSPPGSNTTQTWGSLAAGTYSLVVRDANGCTVTQSQIITTTAIPTITSITPTQPACGTANGAIVVAASGAATLLFSIDNGATFALGTNATTTTFGTLNSGNFNIVVKDGNNCVSAATLVTLAAPGAPTIVSTSTQPTCGLSNGVIDVTTAGTGPFTFSINGAAATAGTTATTINYPSLAGSATAYTIVVTDGSGCTATTSEVLAVSIFPSITSTTPTLATCGLANGAIAITASGVGPLTFSNVSPAVFAAGTSATATSFTGLASATYPITVRDGNGCTAVLNVNIPASTLPTVTSTTPTQATCGSTNGTIAVVATGTGTLTFSIDAGVTYVAGTTATTHTFSNLAAGSFTITVKDTDGCTVNSGPITVSNAGGPTFTTVVTQPACGGTGSILVTPTGTGPFTYSKVNPAAFTAGSTTTTNTFATLASGTYPISVKDVNGCITSQNITLNASSSPIITAPTVVNATCGLANGAINAITVTGGVGPYTFSIDGGTTTQSANTFTGLLGAIPAQVYTINATDANGCAVLAVSVNILTTNNPIINAGPDVSVCVGLPVTLSGSGTATLSWSPAAANNVAFPAAATTTYTLTGTDAQGCSATDAVTVTVLSSAPPVAVFSNNKGCSPLAVTMTNATGSNCVWNFGDGTPAATGCTQTHIYQDAGDYTVTLSASGANGCISSNTFTDTIHVFGHPDASFATTPKELIETDPSFTTINTSTGAISYQWNFGDQTISNATQPIHTYLNSDSTSYIIQLVATDLNGCTDTAYNNVIIYEDLIFYIPNSFTPDGNAFNQTFQPVFESGFDPYNFRMIIFDRWGEVIFETKDAQVGWDGSYLNQELVQSGVYSYKIEFKTKKNDERKRLYGHVNVLR